ncbi:MAG: hypothetical protein DRR06_17840 [Gammaproteobacteria bacterium]|nr:MAG: hypothetical protein DRR06_17840 [Gammaproteobacteria bacterium]
MATISISGGGIETQLTNRATNSIARPTNDILTADGASSPGPADASNPAQSLPAPENPSANNVQAPTVAELKNMASEIQEALDKSSKEPLNVNFRPDERVAGFVIEIRNGDGELVRQFPLEKVLNMRSKLDELSGMVIDEMT